MMTQQPRILVILAGHSIDTVKAEYGNSDAQFARITGLTHEVYDIESWPEQDFPRATDFDGVIVSGSAAMVGDAKPWMLAAKKWIKGILHDEVPFLGVCFGHQILAHAIGADVGPNPNGRANGTRVVSLHDQDDEIFAHLPSEFHVQVSHRDVILSPHSAIKVLGKSDHDSNHIVKIGSCAWGVQFHPEWNMPISETYAKARQSVVDKSILETLAPSPQAESVLKHFVDYCRKRM